MATTARRQIAGRYRLGELLGEGGMSTVSRAHDVLLDRPVALKLLKPAFAADPDFVQRFYAEARAAARIVHPHVVSIFDVVSEPEADGVVMELIEGPSLAEVLAARGRVSGEDAIGYGRSIAQALGAAHAQGIVHGDVKPGNLLLTPDGHLKVSDFGLGPGTPQYAAPEQSAGGVPSPLWDIYALGRVLETLTGGAPEGPLAGAIGQMTAADPGSRLPSAEAADAALAAIQASPPDAAFVETPTLLAQPVPAAEPPRRAAERPQWDWREAFAAAMGSVREASRRAVEPHTDRAARALRVADRRYWVVAVAALLVGVLLLTALDRPRRAVADVRHAPGSVAAQRLTRDGFTPQIVSRSDEREPSGQVLAQSPAPGSLLRQGEPVRLIVSTGPPFVTVPDLLGAPLAQANAAMIRAKLRPKFAAKITEDSPNTVVQEIPAPGSRVRERGTVLVVISTGPYPAIRYSGGGGDGGD